MSAQAEYRIRQPRSGQVRWIARRSEMIRDEKGHPLRLLGVAWPALWPVTVALLLTTLTWPPVRFLRRHRWRPAPAAALVTVLFVLFAASAGIVIVAPVASHSGELANGVANGIQQPSYPWSGRCSPASSPCSSPWSTTA